jgi:hypothetical protein
VSFAATRWAWSLEMKSSTKLVLLAMADCVNAEAGEMLCWPSYRFLARQTCLDAKTVEAGVYRLREAGLIVDTGKRRGETGKVIVYRLNVPENGVVEHGPEGEGGHVPQHANAPESGVVKPDSNDPEFPGNPPKFPAQSPQISGVTTPKTGTRTRNGTSNGIRKESGKSACARPHDVTEQTWADWTALRAKKRTTVSETAIKEARVEADKAGLTLERFLVIWCMRGSQGLQADWLKPHERGPASNGLNAQQALEQSNRAVLARYLEDDRGS